LQRQIGTFLSSTGSSTCSLLHHQVSRLLVDLLPGLPLSSIWSPRSLFLLLSPIDMDSTSTALVGSPIHDPISGRRIQMSDLPDPSFAFLSSSNQQRSPLTPLIPGPWPASPALVSDLHRLIISFLDSSDDRATLCTLCLVSSEVRAYAIQLLYAKLVFRSLQALSKRAFLNGASLREDGGRRALRKKRTGSGTARVG
jgi:hypothetical protein